MSGTETNKNPIHLETWEKTEGLFYFGEKIKSFEDFMKKLEKSFNKDDYKDPVLDILAFYEQHKSDKKALQDELGIELSSERKENLIARGKEMFDKANSGDEELDIIGLINLSVQAGVSLEEFGLTIAQLKLLRIIQKEQLLESFINMVDWGNYDITTLANIYLYSKELQKEIPTEFLEIAYKKLLEEEQKIATK